MVEFLLAGLRFIFVILIYLFLWHALKLMYLELAPEYKRSRGTTGRPVLTVLETKNPGIKKGERYTLGENITIGRDRQNDIVINDFHISARHAVIVRRGEEWQLLDMNSTNGTYVNGRLLNGPVVLRPGDEVRLGGVTFKVGWEDASRSPFPYRTGATR
ncbi:FHA domain-containing protein [Moorella sulfitireducens]|uniref:FHA domain-containing protein n=1 Tax=Neomoorella sulfitireducens TaxID=2972948 RepID=UPI0021AD1C25|nr:FHA domain-containing protein [Moorella sulfitireducens]